MILCLIWIQTPTVTAYSHKNRELKVRTTAYTHSESDHVKYGRKTALGTTLKFTQEYTSAASDWSRFPVGTEFRIKGLNRHFVIDDYGSALVGKDTIDLYFTSKSAMNRWGVQHVDIVITKYGDFEKSREILSGRTKFRHCRTMLAGIEANKKESEGKEPNYEPVPEVPSDIDLKLMATASIPKSEWDLPAPVLLPDPSQPVIEPDPEFQIASAEDEPELPLFEDLSEIEIATVEVKPVPQPVLVIQRKPRRFREIFASSFQTVSHWRAGNRQTGELHIPVSYQPPVKPEQQAQPKPGQQRERKVRKFRPL